jgi:hypothetical protein
MRLNRPLLVVGFMLLFAAVSFYQDPEWNGNSRLLLTRAVVEQGTVRVDAYQSNPDWHTEDIALYNGHYYSDKGIGSSLLGVPFYFLLYNIALALHLQLTSVFIKHFLTSTVMGLALALNGIIMLRIAERLGASPRRALVATLGIALGTMLWPYSAVYYGHLPAATCLIIAFYSLLCARLEPTKPVAGRYFAAGLAMGMAFITEYTSGLIIAGLVLYAALSLRDRPARSILQLAGIGAAGALLPLAVMLAYNYGIYGNALTIGYAHEASNTFQEQMSAGLMGIHFPRRSVLYHITLDPRFGILWQSPILLLAPVGYAMTLRIRRWRAEGAVSLYAVSVMLLMNAGYYLWWGGHAFGPRLIIPCLPFLIVPLSLLPPQLDMPAAALGVLSAGQMLIPLLGEVQISMDFRQRFNSFFIEGSQFDGFSILYQHGLPLISQRLAQGRASWTLGSAIGLPYWIIVPALVAVEGTLFYWYACMSQQQARAPHSKEVSRA